METSESQHRNPEFRINPENFHQCVVSQHRNPKFRNNPENFQPCDIVPVVSFSYYPLYVSRPSRTVH